MSEYSVPARPISFSSNDQINFWEGSLSNPFGDRSNNSSETVYHACKRDSSSDSPGSLAPCGFGPLRVRNANMLSRTASFSTIHVAGCSENAPFKRKSSKQALHKSSWGNDISVPPPYTGSTLLLDEGPLEDIALDLGENGFDDNEEFKSGPKRSLSFETKGSEALFTRPLSTKFKIPQHTKKPLIIITDTTSQIPNPFKRWMSTLRRQKSRNVASLTPRHERWSLDDFDEEESVKLALPGNKTASQHRKTSSWSSSGFVTAVKSASVSLGPPSVPPQSRKIKRSTLLRSSNRSSRCSDGANRASIDSSQGSAPGIDEAAWDRAIQRRRTLEELISSEESYITDLKLLLNVYFTLIASASSESQRRSPQIQRNVTEILALHEELLTQIRNVMPDSEIKSDLESASRPRNKHTRWHSLETPLSVDGASTIHSARRSIEATWFGRPKWGVLVSDPREVVEVAKVFGRMMGRFFVYEEYGAKYEAMLLELTSTSRTIRNWHVYERGIEALANSLAPTNSRMLYSRKGLTFEDLLIKPIQRVCKYPLIFEELYKSTPVVDGPVCRGEVEKVLCRLRETAKIIDRATNDLETRARIQRSWHLQDLLILPDIATAPASLRLLGHATLCGVLYVAYQTKKSVSGIYMLCVLFKSYLLLATPAAGGARYHVVAVMGLSDLQIDKPDNGRGLQCHTAPHSWKLSFESNQQLYELILCACSAREEEQWKSSLLTYSAREDQTRREEYALLPPLFSMLSLDIRSLGYVFGLAGTLTRRISIQRAATMSPRTNSCQVIIRNTNALKEHIDIPNPATNLISRSQSLLSTNNMVILAPKRADRYRMESALTNVWTRDLLPYPGMSPNFGEHLIRTSANSVMRKLSRASITSSFTKRAPSHTSLLDDKMALNQVNSEPIAEKETPDRSMSCLHRASNALPTVKDGAVVGLRCIEPPPRTSSVRGTKFARVRRSLKNRHGVGVMAKAVSCEEVSALASLKEINSKRSNPRIHLKTFSADGIRNWFN